MPEGYAAGVLCPLPTEGRVASVAFEYCLEEHAPCDEHEWREIPQSAEMRPEHPGGVVLIPAGTIGPVDSLRCVNFEQNASVVTQLLAEKYIPEPGVALSLFSGIMLLAALAVLRRWR